MTPEQQVKFNKAIGDGSTWPELTDDPEVNYEIDRHVDPEEDEGDWETLSKDRKEMYIEEAKLYEEED